MGAGMLDDSPPVEIEAVLAYVELLLHLDPGDAEEGREVGRHRVGQVHHAGEAARRLGRGGRGRCRRRGGKSRGQRAGPPEESTPGQRLAHRFLASGNAHGSLLSATAFVAHNREKRLPVFAKKTMLERQVSWSG